MLELFAIETGTNIAIGIVRSLYAALNRFAGHSADIDVATQETPSQEPMGGGQNVQA
jgi:hypothetical protein